MQLKSMVLAAEQAARRRHLRDAVGKAKLLLIRARRLRRFKICWLLLPPLVAPLPARVRAATALVQQQLP